MAAAENSCVLVYDVGGSHVAASVCHQDQYRLDKVVRSPLPTEPTLDAFVAMLALLAEQAASGSPEVEGASLAMPGPFDYKNGISWMEHKLPYLYGKNLMEAFANRLHKRPRQIRFINDAAAYLLGEIGAGAGRGIDRVVCITLGTGIGSAFALNGRVVSEGPGVPQGGEIWNLPFEDGIVEDLISARALRERYRRSTGAERDLVDLAQGASDDPEALRAFAEFGRDLGRVLRTLLQGFTPQVVVLGGGIARSANLFLPAAQRELQGLGFQLRISMLGDCAPLVGAGVAWFRAASEPEPSEEIDPSSAQ